MLTEFCAVNFLKTTKERLKEKEKEEFPERQGQTECKVITFFLASS